MLSRYGINSVEILGIALSLFVISSESAQAYIDPGTGSYVLQAVVAGTLAAAFVIKSTWRNIKEAFGKRFLKRTIDDK